MRWNTPRLLWLPRSTRTGSWVHAVYERTGKTMCTYRGRLWEAKRRNAVTCPHCLRALARKWGESAA